MISLFLFTSLKLSWVHIHQPLSKTLLILTLQQQTAFENILGKEAISSFPRMFSTQSENRITHLSIFVNIYKIISLFASETEETKIGI